MEQAFSKACGSGCLVLCADNGKILNLRCYVSVTCNPSQWVERRQDLSSNRPGFQSGGGGSSGAPSQCWELKCLASQLQPSKDTSTALTPNYLDGAFLVLSLAGRKGAFSFYHKPAPVLQCEQNPGTSWLMLSVDLMTQFMQ